MLYFIYTYAEKVKAGHCHKTVRIYKIKKNLPVFMGEMTDTFVDEFQLVMMAMEAFKLLPAHTFERNPTTGSLTYHYKASLVDAGIAHITRVS